jgi:hypothetical protein
MDVCLDLPATADPAAYLECIRAGLARRGWSAVEMGPGELVMWAGPPGTPAPFRERCGRDGVGSGVAIRRLRSRRRVSVTVRPGQTRYDLQWPFSVRYYGLIASVVVATILLVLACTAGLEPFGFLVGALWSAVFVVTGTAVYRAGVDGSGRRLVESVHCEALAATGSDPTP